MTERRVAITGIGAITPVGTGRANFWNGIRAERSAVRSLTRFDPSIFRSHNAAEVDDFRPDDHIEAKRAKRLDRFGQFSVAAARMALEDCGVRLEREDRERIGAMMGTALGGVGYAEEQLGRFLSAGLRAVDATLALAVFGGAASCNIAIEFGVSGPNSTNAMSCASGTMAIGEAFRQIRHGYADVMLAGGAEAPLAPLCFGAFALIRAMSTRNDEPAAGLPAVRQGPRRVRDGRGIGGAGARGMEPGQGARREDLRRALRLRHDERRASHDRAAPHRRAGGARDAARAGRRAPRAGGDRIHQRARQLDAAERPERDDRHQAGLRRARAPRAGERHQGLLRPRARRERRVRGGDLRALARRRVASADGEPRRRPTRRATSIMFRARAAPARVEHVLSNSFGFGGINAALVLRRAS